MQMTTTPGRAGTRRADAPPRVEVMVSAAAVVKALALALSLGILLTLALGIQLIVIARDGAGR